MGMMIILGETILENEPWSASAARRYVRAMIPMTGAVADDIELITSELVTNAVQHGGPDRIGLKVAGDENVVRVEVTDSGSGKPPRLGVAADGESGRGLVHVGVLSERWGVRQSTIATTVWAELRRS
jgi:anti-sigma regulatory factor (Ser/Thr protein kinase)